MSNIVKKYGIFILLCISVGLNFIQRSCSKLIESKPITVTITTPEQKGSIKESTIKEIDGTANKIQYKDKIAYVENPSTQRQLDLYLKENDSLKRLKMYGEAITEHTQTNTFENEYLKADITSTVQGKLKSLSLDNYTIKSRELPITIPPPKETNFALFLGGGGYYDNKHQELGYKVGATFQNKKGDQLTLEYAPINKAILLDYKFRIINHKK